MCFVAKRIPPKIRRLVESDRSHCCYTSEIPPMMSYVMACPMGGRKSAGAAAMTTFSCSPPSVSRTKRVRNGGELAPIGPRLDPRSSLPQTKGVVWHFRSRVSAITPFPGRHVYGGGVSSTYVSIKRQFAKRIHSKTSILGFVGGYG